MNNAFLRYCGETYETLKKRLHRFDRIRDAEAALSWIQKLAQYASTQHPGRYTDGEIENIALEIGKNLDRILEISKIDSSYFNVPTFEKSPKRHILHIATQIPRIKHSSKKHSQMNL